MTREILDTKPNFPDKDIADGIYTFAISIVSKKDIKGKIGYEWNLNYDGKEAQILLWPSNMGPLLRVLGVKETETNKFMFDTIEVEGKTFKATAYKDKKGYQQLKDYAATGQPDDSLPF